VQPLPQRLFGGGRAEHREQVGVVAQGQFGLCPVLQHGQPAFGEIGEFGLGDRSELEAVQRPAAPEAERPRPQLRGGGQVALGGGLPPLPGQVLEDQPVEVGGGEVDLVAGRPGPDRRPVEPQRPAQCGHVGAQRAGGGRRRPERPQGGGQLLHGDRAVGVDQQEREQRAWLGGVERQGTAIGVVRLERTQDTEPHDPPFDQKSRGGDRVGSTGHRGFANGGRLAKKPLQGYLCKYVW
jgi:hypothetical protein